VLCVWCVCVWCVCVWNDTVCVCVCVCVCGSETGCGILGKAGRRRRGTCRLEPHRALRMMHDAYGMGWGCRQHCKGQAGRQWLAGWEIRERERERDEEEL
jgi:hypothetical protein